MSNVEGQGLAKLVEVMARLRDPETGCPWDLEQSFASIAPYTIEEAYEVADAIERDDREALPGELGDLLLQVVYHARLGEELGLFDLDRIAAAAAAKMIRRHPHVFGDATVASAAEQSSAWEDGKAGDRAAAAERRGRPAGTLDDVPVGLPGLARAQKLQARAARVGFDWPDRQGVWAKVAEETAELEAALAQAGSGARYGSASRAVAEELGDLLFSLVNLARWLDLDAEAVMRDAGRKFERRFAAMEQALTAGGLRPLPRDLATLEAAWVRAKAAETGPP